MINKICKNDICCIIITYNPTIELEKLLNIIINQVSKIIIVDNFSVDENYKIIESSKQFDKLTIIRNKFNLGIAKALNQGVNEAINLGYKWVVNFDQDTEPKLNFIDILIEVYNHFPNKKLIGAIGVNSVDLNGNIYFKVPKNCIYLIKDYLITSGTMISTNLFTEIEGFEEKLFIDNVDLDYSLKIRSHGKVSIISEKCGMIHKPGNSFSKLFMGINIESSNHNSIRRFYMSRNNIYLTKKYYLRFPYFILKMNYFHLLSIFKMLTVEKDRKNKLIYTFKGFKEGIFF